MLNLQGQSVLGSIGPAAVVMTHAGVIPEPSVTLLVATAALACFRSRRG